MRKFKLRLHYIVYTLQHKLPRPIRIKIGNYYFYKWTKYKNINDLWKYLDWTD